MAKHMKGGPLGWRRMVKGVGYGIVRIGDLGRRGSGLHGDRDIEWAWVVSRLGKAPGRVLDFGCGGSSLGFVAAMSGYEVIAVDLTEVRWAYSTPGLTFRRLDILDGSLDSERFDVIINCSSVEHVGLGGRYGSQEESEGDLVAMGRLASLAPAGRMLLTIPVGCDGVYRPWHRVYGPVRLPRLLEGWRVLEQEFWAKGEGGWRSIERQSALAVPSGAESYALGLFVLVPA